MGESCEEGGPSPSHKIPQENEDGIKCSKQFYIHLPKRSNTIDLLMFSESQLQTDHRHRPPPFHVDVSAL